jgi:hypothetical protein
MRAIPQISLAGTDTDKTVSGMASAHAGSRTGGRRPRSVHEVLGHQRGAAPARLQQHDHAPAVGEANQLGRLGNQIAHGVHRDVAPDGIDIDQRSVASATSGRQLPPTEGRAGAASMRARPLPRRGASKLASKYR